MMNYLHKVIQLRDLFPVELSIWTDRRGLFHGKVYSGSGKLLLKSHNKQFINELLEELDGEASVFLEKNVKE